MTKALDFQTIIFTLQQYWSQRGCLIWQPYYAQVGAGTMNPATFLRVLGPEPWNVAYVEPSIRPDDGRYGMNPNRLQQHYQFQVILKPDPGNPQELYLQSLEALGIDPKQHDIRFVEDNWESPALGAWGLGWEVWLDGQEITQFTYFQQAGGKSLDVVSVEITYGLERIAMALQKVNDFKSIQWNPQRTYGDVNLTAEREHSQYYFDVADIEQLRKMYDLFQTEGARALSEGLVLPAYDYLIKCSHTFNILDARGAVGVTERQVFFGKMRDLSRQIADAYVKQREHIEFPWLGDNNVRQPSLNIPQSLPMSASDDFLLEIGTEELPPADFRSALEQLNQLFPQLLNNNRLQYTNLKVMGTPRRLVVLVNGLQTQQADREIELKGPPANLAFDSEGLPTKAAQGFARSKGISIDQLKVREDQNGSYTYAVLSEIGKSSVDVLTQALPELIAQIRFNKAMRWNQSAVSFSRPVRWLLALHGANVITFAYAGLVSDRNTHGLRFSQPVVNPVDTPQDYLSFINSQGILLDVNLRKQSIAEQVNALAKTVDGFISDDPDLLEEVTQLVEYPTAMLGSFASEYLESLPSDVLIAVMKKHQRYFPVFDAEGKLLPYFILVRNGGKDFEDVVVEGNLQVIQARFADAAFFIKEDLQKKLSEFIPSLASLTFQKDLGSMLDKTERIEAFVPELGKYFQLDNQDMSITMRAASLCKADLASSMVVEMTSLQGIMGRYYALASGEEPKVADVIFEHYLPRFSGDKHPKSLPALVVGIADRLDTLAGLFSVGLATTGTRDPFAQRRAALGLVQNLIHWDLDFDLEWGLREAGRGVPGRFTMDTLQSCLDFILGRLRGSLLDQGYRYDVVDAVLAAQGINPAGAKRAVDALTPWLQRPDWEQILPAYSRCVRITRDLKQVYPLKEDLLLEPQEKSLYQALRQAEAAIDTSKDPQKCLTHFLPLIPVINNFFDAVLVMAEDEALKHNRLGLLQRIAALVKPAADLSYLEGF